MSYDPNLSSERDVVRLLIGDQSSTLFTDAEIEAMIGIYGSAQMTAAALADSLAAKYSALTSISVDGLTVSNGDKAAAYRALAARLRSQAAISSPGGLGQPFVGGVSIGAVDAANQDTDRVPSSFQVGQFDDPPRDTIDPRNLP